MPLWIWGCMLRGILGSRPRGETWPRSRRRPGRSAPGPPSPSPQRAALRPPSAGPAIRARRRTAEEAGSGCPHRQGPRDPCAYEPGETETIINLFSIPKLMEQNRTFIVSPKVLYTDCYYSPIIFQNNLLVARRVAFLL